MTSTTQLRVAVVLAAVTGWLSLSHEILWVRVIYSGWHNSPMAFGTTLGAFLLGLACGAIIAPALQRRLAWSAVEYIAASVGLAGVLLWLLPGVGAAGLLLSDYWGMVLLHASVALDAAVLGGLLPLVARHGVAEDAEVGASVSIIYFANVVGATIGPLFTGFLLLEWLSLPDAILVVGAAGLVASVAIAWSATRAVRGRVIGVAAAALALMLIGNRPLYDGFAERLHFRTSVPEARYAFVASGRAGSVGVLSNDQLYGDGIYDGAFNVNPWDLKNGIDRAYFLAVLHPNPRRVLKIGLGSGSWVSVIASYPDVESLIAVEINPKYVDAIRRFPDIAAALDDPKVTLAIDDGRRWLRRHPTERFDAIVINTSWHWRAFATHLLSVEFFRELRGHLLPGGVVYFNTTESADAARTAADVFAHAVRFGNFVAVSDRKFEMPAQRRIERLRRFPGLPGAGPVFLHTLNVSVMESMAADSLTDIAPALRASVAVAAITEDNMITEFKSNWSGSWWRALPERVFAPERGWLSVLFP